MKKGEKILFIIALIIAAAALLFACFSAYFGIYFVVLKLGGAQPLSTALTGLLFILVTFISWSLSLLSLPFFILSPVRSEQKCVRRASLVLLCVLGGFFVLNACLLIVVI